MISTRQRRAIKALALFLIFTVAQVYIQVNFAGPNVREATPSAAQGGGQLTGKLITTGGKPILVNGASLGSGGTLLSGATIDVPDGIGATVNLGPLGRLDLSPNTTAVLEFINGQVNVKLIKGCVVLHTRKGNKGEISTDKGVAATTDPKKDDVADVCSPLGAPAPIVNQGAAANAGAGAGGGAAGAGGGGGGLFGLGPLGTLAIIGGTIAGGIGIYEATKSSDRPASTSPATP
jgi:hypothetical protein